MNPKFSLNFLILFNFYELFLALTNDERITILNAHNEYRYKLANGKAQNANGKFLPAASNMKNMIYDLELEKKAQIWASKCLFQHSPYYMRLNTGENLYYSKHQTNNIKLLLEATNYWWNELGKYDFNPRIPFQFNNRIGHFTQMAWAKTKRVGCGITKCSTKTLILCNYAQKGNIEGEEVYKIS